MASKKLTIAETHQLRIARTTLEMAEAFRNVMGGPTVAEAKETIKRLGSKQDVARFEK